MTDSKKFARRDFLKTMATAASLGACATALPSYALAEDLPHLTEVDPTAAALGYKDDATRVDAVKYPTRKTGQVCANCQFFAGSVQTPWAACQLFPGKAVAAKGWCSGYNAKP